MSFKNNEIRVFLTKLSFLHFRWYQNGVPFKSAAKDTLKVQMGLIASLFALKDVIMDDALLPTNVNANQDSEEHRAQNVSKCSIKNHNLAKNLSWSSWYNCRLKNLKIDYCLLQIFLSTSINMLQWACNQWFYRYSWQSQKTFYHSSFTFHCSLENILFKT